MAPRKRTALAGFCATLAVALMSVPTFGVRDSAAGDVSSPNVVKQTNDVRVRNGLGRLSLDPLLTRAAQSKAEDMAARGYFAHEAPDGRSPWDWIERAGYKFLAAAENLAVGYPDDADLISAWMGSEGHRHNLLNQKYTDIGIGIAHGKYKGQETVFVVQMFGKPRTSAERPTLAAVRLAIDLPALASLPLDAVGLQFEPALLAEVPLVSAQLLFDPISLPAFPLETSEAAPLQSSCFLFDVLMPPITPLSATPFTFGPSRLPRAGEPSRRLASILRSLK